jgi:hypothetical protein
LIQRTPADGMVAGIGRVNGDVFGDTGTQCAAMSYDYTVLAGTTTPSSQVSIAARFNTSPSFPAKCRWLASTQAVASRATLRSSVVATS